jgi:uncharacterized protein YpiB (UPF0302 family)
MANVSDKVDFKLSYIGRYVLRTRAARVILNYILISAL